MKYTESEIQHATECLAAMMRGKTVLMGNRNPKPVSDLEELGAHIMENAVLTISPKPHPLDELTQQSQELDMGYGGEE